MELVYLWVEDYKNIRKQGFNFSPRFRCEYDEETNELTIDENKNYVSIFPDNINVTAIVGENGSGKSSICNILDERLINEKVRVVYFSNNTFYSKLRINIDEKYRYRSIIGDDYYDMNIICKKIDCKEECKEDTENSQLITLSNVLENDLDCFDFIDKNLVFTSWNITFSKSLSPDLNTNIKKLDEIYTLFSKVHLKDEEKYLKVFVYVSVKFIQFILGNNSLEDSAYTESLNNLATDFTKENYIKLAKLIKLEQYNKNKNCNLILSTLINFDESVEYIKNFIHLKKIKKEDISKFINSGVYKTFHNFSKNNFDKKIINIDYKTDNELNFLSLSDGEKQRIINNAFLSEELILKSFENNECCYIGIFDEPDVYIHPQWQKIILNDFIKIAKKYKNLYKTLHLIITTHSPFILSDLPKENIIFLEKGKQVYPFEDGKQTFGANIHTLLSHGFFMKNGLMGEFAKEKIDLAIKYLNQKILTSKELDYCENIIPIIGEPIIKRQLQKMLDSKRLSEIEQIKKEIKALEERMTLIWKNSK